MHRGKYFPLPQPTLEFYFTLPMLGKDRYLQLVSVVEILIFSSMQVIVIILTDIFSHLQYLLTFYTVKCKQLIVELSNIWLVNITHTGVKVNNVETL